MSLPGARYEATSRVCTVLFSVVTGFGLNHILQAKDEFGAARWLIFLITLFTVLRFLFGSANHLWLEYVANDVRTKVRVFLLWDFLWLMTFSVFVLGLCYATDARQFLKLIAVFGGVAAVGGLLGAGLARLSGRPSTGKWFGRWLVINILHGLFGWIAYIFYPGGDSPDLTRVLAPLAFGFLLLLLADLYIQLANVDLAG